MNFLTIFQSRWATVCGSAGVALAVFGLLLMVSRPVAAGGGVIPVCSACTHTTIPSALAVAVSGDTIEVQDAILDMTEPFTITQNITLTGVSSSTTTLNTYPLPDYTYVIYIAPTAEVVIQHLTLTSTNDEPHIGGGIYNQGQLTLHQVSLKRIFVEDNWPEGGPYIHHVLWNTNQLTMTESSLSGTLETGGGLINEGEAFISLSKLNGFYVPFTMGHHHLSQNFSCRSPIANAQQMVITHSEISSNAGRLSRNAQENSAGGCHNVGIYNIGQLELSHSLLDGNSGEDVNFTTEVINNSGHLTVTDTTFQNNLYATILFSHDGVIALHQAIFQDNDQAQISAYQTNLDISQSHFLRNEPYHYGAVALRQNSTAVIADSIFEENETISGRKSGSFGGAVYVAEGSTLEVENSLFTQNQVWYGELPGFGGAIYNQGQLSITGSSFQSNTTKVEGYGGAIYNVGTLTIQDSDLTGNDALFNGGGLWNSGVAILHNTVISDNSSFDSTGGAIWSSGQLTITDSLLENNWVQEFAGGSAIMATGGSLTILHSTIQNHDRYQQGVPIYSNNTAVILQEVTIQNNHIRSGTAGLEIHGGTLVAENVTWHNNRVFRGTGALYVTDGAIVELVNNSFTQNCTIDTSRGAAVGNNNGTIIILESSFIDNRASGDMVVTGGAIQNAAAGEIHLINSVLTDNQVTNLEPESQDSFGGGIANAGTMWVTQTVIANNVAQFGGGVYNTGQLTVVQSAVVNNLSNPLTGGFDGPETGFGAGIAQEGGSLTLVNSTISSNSFTTPTELTTWGAGVYVATGQVDIRYSTIANNSAADEGGGIYQTGGTVLVAGSIVAGNETADCSGTMTSGGYNIFGASTGCVGNGTTDSTVNPAEVFTTLLDTLQDNGGETLTHALLEESAGLDVIPAGTNQCGTTITKDQRGEPRPLNSGCDVGAFEGDTSTIAHLYLWQLNPGLVAVSGENSCTAAYCSYVATVGTAITLTATPATGYTFAHWAGGCAGSQPTCQLTLTQTQVITAVFEPLTYPFTVTVSGPAGGSVTSGLGVCEDSCNYEVTHGEMVTLTAVPTVGITFSHWSGACSGSDLVCVVTVEQAAGVEAVFEEIVLPPASYQVYLPLLLR